MKFLIAGLGSIGRRHLRNLLELGQKDILLFRTYQSTLPDEELAGFPVFTDLAAALSQRPDAVIVANPTALHMSVAIPAARAGYHLFLEKPISHSWEKIEALRAAVQHGNGEVFVGFQFRFHPGLIAIRKLLHQDAIGRPTSVRVHWGEYLPGWHPWEDYRHSYSARPELGGGVILTLCHPLDYLRWLLGEVNSLWAFSGKLSDLDLQVEDTAEIGLRFANGVIGSIHLDYNQRPPSHWLEIIGTRGTIRWDNTEGAARIFQIGAGNNFTQDEWKTISIPTDFERNHLFLNQMRHFLDIINGKAQPICTLDDGIKALQLALAAYDSQEKETMVRL